MTFNAAQAMVTVICIMVLIVLFRLLNTRISDWLLVIIWGLDLGCLALAKNAIEESAVAIKEPRYV